MGEYSCCRGLSVSGANDLIHQKPFLFETNVGALLQEGVLVVFLEGCCVGIRLGQCSRRI